VSANGTRTADIVILGTMLYLTGNTGFDKRLCTMLGIDAQALFAFLAGMPAYDATEQWVGEHASALDRASVDAFNAHIDGAEIVPANDLEDQAGLRCKQGFPSVRIAGCEALFKDRHPRKERHRGAFHPVGGR